ASIIRARSRRGKAGRLCQALPNDTIGAAGRERLGPEEPAQQKWWRQWLHEPLTQAELAAVRRSVTSGRPFGSEARVKTIAARLALPLERRRAGRPSKGAET